MKRIKSFVFIGFFLSCLCFIIPSQSSAQNLSLNNQPDSAGKLNISSTTEKEDLAPADNKPSNINANEPLKPSKETEKEKEEQDMMEKALYLLEIADNSWKKGDIENTLNTLDKAYALLLDTNGDAAIARQKDDLRLLISRRILAVYSAQQTATNGKASEIPLIMNTDVEKEIRSFQGGEREFFISSYQRSWLYKDVILRELKKAGIPEELFWLPLVESGFKISALSRARALGLWQFIPSTGYKFGLSRDEWIDERMDVEKSTLAAIAYLKELHGMFGDWLTVLAAYNCGEGRVLRIISRQHINYFDRFWDLYNQLPRETSRYVPRFLATLHIIKNPQKYGFELQKSTEKPIAFEPVKVNKVMKLHDIAAKMEVSEELMNILNAELRYKITPDREYEIKIPKGSMEKFNLVANDIPESEKPKFSSGRMVFLRHRVKQGETVASIARRYRTSSSTILSYNNINTKKGLSAGQKLRIPVYRAAAATNKTKQKVNKSQINIADSKGLYKIRQGDTLLIIAKRFNIPVARLKEINNLKTNSIQIGQVLKISTEEALNPTEEKNDNKNIADKAPKKQQITNQTLTAADVAELGTNKYIVTKGDNLSMIAQKNKINVMKLMQLNNLTGDETLTPGQILIVKQ